MTALVVERPGLLTTVQDGGRHGWQHLGVPVSGWMDDWSATLANRLAGNPPGHAVLEITLVGPTLKAHGPVTIAVAGAIFDVTVGTRSLRSPFVTSANAGETIAFGMRRRGTRAYLACRGGVVAPTVLGSASTDIRAGLGGRRLRAGDALAIGPASSRDRQPHEFEPPDWLFQPSLRMLPGPDDEQWTATALEALVESPYAIAPASDRTGYRLEGQTLPAPSGVMVSAPVVTGTLQVPPSGQPILLMADCQTTGGYARLGVLAAADRAVAAQLGPGDRCTFVRCSWAEAARAAAERGAFMNAVVESAR